MADGDGQAPRSGHARPGPRRVLVATPVTPATRAVLASLPAAAYLPSLASEPGALAAALEDLCPDTLVVGANPVDGETLRRWARAVRAAGPGRRLVLVRRGTGVSAIDLRAAEATRIEVRNTPRVNARYVARYAVDALLARAPLRRAGGTRPLTVGLLGLGEINSLVARELAAGGHYLVAHTPRLAACGPALLTDALAGAGLAGAHESGRLRVTGDVESLFAGTDLVAVAVPVTDAPPDPTRGLIRRRHIKTFSGSGIVSVAEPEVFGPAALRESYARRDISVLIDNAAPLLATVRRDIAEWFGDADEPRPGFELRSDAMRAPGCGDDLDQAFLLSAASAELTDSAARPAACPPPVGGDRPVAVVGGGIAGLTVALALSDAGWSDVEVLDAAPADRTDPATQGTTYSGTDGRHMSLTETLPHADASRRDTLRRGVEAGGWLARDPSGLDERERSWAGSFERLADRPGLHAQVCEAVVALNGLGLRGWEALFTRRPELLAGVRTDERMPRIYLSGADLARGRALQGRVNAQARPLARAELAARWPALDAGVVAGAIEVDGYAVNIHRLADNLRAALGEVGVRVSAGTRVVGVDLPEDDLPDDDLPAGGWADPPALAAVAPAGDRLVLRMSDGRRITTATAVLTVGGRDLAGLATPFSSGVTDVVQHVLGCSLTLPNPGLSGAVKIQAPDPVGVVNVTLSPDGERIHASGGFCWLGLAGPERDGPAVAAVVAALEKVVARLFPSLVQADGTLPVLDRRTCERPMTPDGLPVVEYVDGFDGRLVVAGGTNAGGTVQAPALATLVSTLLAGEAGCAHASLRTDRATLRPRPADTGATAA